VRILVYPHDLGIGGSQINAIDLAAGVARAGHEVIVYGIPGPLEGYIQQRGLRFIPARPLRYRPAPSRIAQLAAIASRERLDLIHAYEWPPCLDAYFGAGLILGVPVLSTVLGMTLMPLVPPSVPLIMGTEDLGAQARKVYRAGVWVLEPPIDVEQDHPAIDGREFRAQYDVAASELLVVSVSRLAADLKLDALVRAIDAVDLLAGKYQLRLVVIGGGPAHAALLERAGAVNARWGREIVTLPGPLMDPRPAYAAADVVVGMGSSALRALAMAKPVIVQGEGAFSLIFEPDTLPVFLHQGFYGLADNAPGAARLAEQLQALLSSSSRRAFLGNFGREVVSSRFSLERAVQVQLQIYQEVLHARAGRHVMEAFRSVWRAAKREIYNHDPRQKRSLALREATLFAAARSGVWPPGPDS
jgi:glycosyltransferase involved in cell wall biosynthesis